MCEHFINFINKGKNKKEELVQRLMNKDLYRQTEKKCMSKPAKLVYGCISFYRKVKS